MVDGPPGLSASAARNAGVRRATGDVLVFVDADVKIHPDALTRVKAAFAACPELTAVFGSYDDSPPTGGTVAGSGDGKAGIRPISASARSSIRCAITVACTEPKPEAPITAASCAAGDTMIVAP